LVYFWVSNLLGLKEMGTYFFSALVLMGTYCRGIVCTLIFQLRYVQINYTKIKSISLAVFQISTVCFVSDLNTHCLLYNIVIVG
jgi:hypothetical protein